MQYLIVTKTFKDAYAVLCTCIAPGEKCTSFHYICFVHLYCTWRKVYKFPLHLFCALVLHLERSVQVSTTSVLCTCIAPGEKCTSFHYICFVHLYCIWRKVYKFPLHLFCALVLHLEKSVQVSTTSVLCTCIASGEKCTSLPLHLFCALVVYLERNVQACHYVCSTTTVSTGDYGVWRKMDLFILLGMPC